MRVVLRHAAHVRSGDKGDISTLGVFAYTPELYEILKAQVTAEALRQLYKGAVTGKIERFEVDAIHALNFAMHGALGGGVSRSLSMDNYGKALGAVALRLELEIPPTLSNHLRAMPPHRA